MPARWTTRQFTGPHLMTATSRLIVFRLVPDHLNGVWMEVLPGSIPPFWVQDGDERVELVMTGDVEWDGLDNCAEVVVPVERLGEWRREHADA